ncbi:hypothetical protein ACFFK0_17035 [Paenibacillus chartarius]|uniref:Uncharacterized protein n=1 Tax=Paenibacillus chartarius TaxID=747481 RepID=A0ABV6DNA5_9BACL
MVKGNVWTKLVLTAILAITAIAGTIRSGTAEAAAVTGNNGVRVELGEGQSLEVTDVRMFQYDMQSVCSFEVAVRNESETDLQLDDYYFRVTERSGNVLDFRLLPEDRGRMIVPSGTAGVYRFYGTVRNGLDPGKLLLEVGRWDFDSASLQDRVGEVTLADASPGEHGSMVEIRAGNAVLQAALTAAASRSTGESKEVTWTVTIRNSDSISAELPNWSFWLQTPEKRTFSMTPDKTSEGLRIEPGGELSFILTASLPAEEDLTHAGILMTRILSESSQTAPIYVPTAYLPMSEAVTRTAEGDSRIIPAAEGEFSVLLESVQRWPWDNRDLINAALQITNVSGTAAPVPNLTGTFRADDTEEWAAQSVRTDSLRLLQPGQSIRMFLQAQLDHREVVRSWDIFLQENVTKDGKAQAVHRTEWSDREAVSAVEVDPGNESVLDGIGGNWSYKASPPIVYESATGQLVTVRVDAMNRDKRYNPVAKWIAQWITEDGTIYPAEVEATEQRVVPQGKASLMASTALPKGMDINGMKLMLGLAVTGGKLSGAKETPDSFLQATVFKLPDMAGDPGGNTNRYMLHPYTLILNKVHHPYWNPSGKNTFIFKLEFDYQLLKDVSFVTEMKQRRLLVELLDGNGEQIHEESYVLESDAGGVSSLDVGSGTEEWAVEVDSLSMNISRYTLNIYEEFSPGYRRLLGSTSSDWMK